MGLSFLYAASQKGICSAGAAFYLSAVFLSPVLPKITVAYNSLRFRLVFSSFFLVVSSLCGGHGELPCT